MHVRRVTTLEQLQRLSRRSRRPRARAAQQHRWRSGRKDDSPTHRFSCIFMSSSFRAFLLFPCCASQTASVLRFGVRPRCDSGSGKVGTERELDGVIVNFEGIDMSGYGRCDGKSLLVPAWFESSEEVATVKICGSLLLPRQRHEFDLDGNSDEAST